MKKNVTAIVRRFHIATLVIWPCFFLAFFLLLRFVDSVWISLPVGLSLGFAAWFLRTRESLRLSNILMKDLDGETYGEVFQALKQPSNASYHFSGKFQEAYYISNRSFHQGNSCEEKDFALSALALLYFELGDLERLRWACEEYDRLNEGSPRLKKKKESNDIFEFYKAYLAEDFEACKTFWQSRIDKAQKPQEALFRLRGEYALALIAYREKNFEEATTRFRTIAQNAPRIHYAALSLQYLENIENQEEFTPRTVEFSEELLETPSEKLPNTYATRKRNRAVWFILLTSLLLLILLGSFVWTKDLLKEQCAKEIVLAETLGFEDVEPLAKFNILNSDGKSLESVFLFESSDQGIVLASSFYYTEDEDRTVHLGIVCDQITSQQLRFGSLPVSGKRVGVKLYSDQKEIPSYAVQRVKIKVDGTTCWFVVEHLQ